MERRNPRPTHPGGGDRTFCMVQTPHHHVRPVDTGRGDTEVAWEQMGAIAVTNQDKVSEHQVPWVKGAVMKQNFRSRYERREM